MEEPAWSASPVEFPSLSELRPSEASKALLSFRDPDVEGKKPWDGFGHGRVDWKWSLGCLRKKLGDAGKPSLAPGSVP